MGDASVVFQPKITKKEIASHSEAATDITPAFNE
jgi:hypothetical protein